MQCRCCVCLVLVAVQACQFGPVYSGPGASKSQQKLSRMQKESLRRAKKYAVEQCIKSVLLKQTIAHQHQQTVSVQQSAQKQQALSLMCRIYVGSINFGIQEDIVKQAFLPFGPIKSISLPYDTVLRKHKGFAFIEYDIPEAASLAVEQMNGVMLGGFSIKVGRPSNMPQAKAIIEHIMKEATFYNRIYVASIHQDLTEADVRSVFESFGKITSCKLSSEPLRPSKHRGYGYIEYETSAAVDEAVAAMNLFDLGGIHLRVGKCVTPPNVNQVSVMPSSMPTASAIAAASITAKLNIFEAAKQPVSTSPSVVTQPAVPSIAVDSVTAASTNVIHPQLSSTFIPAPPPSMCLPPPFDVAQAEAVQASVYQQQSAQSVEMSQQNVDCSDSNTYRQDDSECRVMVLENMVDAESIDDELEDEVADECGKFGCVTRVTVSSQQDSDSYEQPADTSDDVKIFVEFSLQSEMESAVSALNGRYFAGRAIIARPHHEQSHGS